MNCDYVFECLTRGPFPSGHDDDVAIERHLRACHECRQVAAALQPAVGLFHEAMSSEETIGLPCYAGEAGSVAVKPHAVVRATPRPRREFRRSISRMVPFAIAAMLCAVAAWHLVAEPLMNPAPPETSNVVGIPADAMMRLAALEIPDTCLTAAGSMDTTHCCTQCHNAAMQDRVPIVGVTQLASSCMICHTR